MDVWSAMPTAFFTYSVSMVAFWFWLHCWSPVCTLRWCTLRTRRVPPEHMLCIATAAQPQIRAVSVCQIVITARLKQPYIKTRGMCISTHSVLSVAADPGKMSVVLETCFCVSSIGMCVEGAAAFASCVRARPWSVLGRVLGRHGFSACTLKCLERSVPTAIWASVDTECRIVIAPSCGLLNRCATQTRSVGQLVQCHSTWFCCLCLVSSKQRSLWLTT
jgi:hypothetical protein